MDIAHSVPSVVASASFSFMTGDDIRRTSYVFPPRLLWSASERPVRASWKADFFMDGLRVLRITNPTLLDNLNRPNKGGLYDPALGPSESRDL